MAEHLILGQMTDYLTGEMIDDTLDERERQKIARFLVKQKAYTPSDLVKKTEIPLQVNGDQAIYTVDFLIHLNEKDFMMVLFAPGSLVTRERSALAAARLANKGYIIPFVVITNGQDAEILATSSGKTIGKKLQAIPSKKEALKLLDTLVFEGLAPEKRDKEERLLFFYEVLAERECREFVCQLAFKPN